MADDKGMTYEDSGVKAVESEESFNTLINWVQKTMQNRPEVKTEVGLYATVLDIGGGRGLAMSTDGVGTKLIVAQQMEKYDTVGIDCIAMNVNDLICVGARPMAMLDYIAVQDVSHPLLGMIGKGLYDGAMQADISIPAGEIAQLREMIVGEKEGTGFDLVGTAVGLVDLDKMIVGEGINEGDVVVGLAGSGIHSNGYTLARKVLLSKYRLDEHLDELGTTVGLAMLEPTRIYVKPVMQIIEAELGVKALLHITGDGFRNMRRVRSEVGYVLDSLPEPLPIFKLIQREGNVSAAEMANTFNMGVGLCVVLPDDKAKIDRVIDIAGTHGVAAQVIGHAVKDPKRTVSIPAWKVEGAAEKFVEVA